MCVCVPIYARYDKKKKTLLKLKVAAIYNEAKQLLFRVVDMLVKNLKLKS